MVSLCQWPFSSFLLASALLKSTFCFNDSGTLQSSAVVSYDIILNIDKKLNLISLRQKIEFGLCKKIRKICNFNYKTKQNLKDAYSSLSGDKIRCSFYFDSYPSLGHLISRTLPINVIGYTNNSRVSFANTVSKMKKKQESLLQALIKRDMLLVATCCIRIFVSVISSCFA